MSGKLLFFQSRVNFNFDRHSSDARELLKDYLIGELIESERTEFKSQYVYTSDNKEGGPTPLFWVLGVALTAVAAYFYVNRMM